MAVQEWWVNGLIHRSAGRWIDVLVGGCAGVRDLFIDLWPCSSGGLMN